MNDFLAGVDALHIALMLVIALQAAINYAVSNGLKVSWPPATTLLIEAALKYADGRAAKTVDLRDDQIVDILADVAERLGVEIEFEDVETITTDKSGAIQ